MVGIGSLGAARAAMAANLLPIIVAGLAWALLGERLHAYHFIGGSVTLLGVVISLRKWSDDTAAGEDIEAAAWLAEEA